ncbi:MAG: hypothetical protein E4H36_02235 [Spirochaetales bacterium]|nr:MAG: hypothetical protein E4H36_02235 [Spirochaetales bacterium]
MKPAVKLIFFTGLCVLVMSCSIQKAAINMISDALSGTGGSSAGGTSTASALTGDDDIELVGDALPFALKLYETLLSQNPDHVGLLMTTGMGFIMYANAFVQTPADMMPQEDYEKQAEMVLRAKKLYIRGRDYVLKAIELKHKGFRQALDSDDFETALSGMKKPDADSLYWASAGWLAAFSINPFDISLTMQMPKVLALIGKVLELDESYGKGGLHDLLFSVQASLPDDLKYRTKIRPENDSVRRFFDAYYAGIFGKDGSATPEEKARHHFGRALVLAEGKNPSPYLSLAAGVCIPNQYADEFIKLCNKALAVDPALDPDNKLAVILAQNRARWYLDNINQFFLLETEEDFNNDDMEGE